MGAHMMLNHEQEFAQAMEDAGVIYKDRIIADGVIYRFPTGKKGRKDGWFVFRGMAGAFGDWSQGIHKKWSVGNLNLSPMDQTLLREQEVKAWKTGEEEIVRKHEAAVEIAFTKWNGASETGSSPYLARKKVGAYGVRFGGKHLIIPLRDAKGKLWSFQWIEPDGKKQFLKGGKKKGCFHQIGVLEDGKTIYIVEGYATGASVHMATLASVVVAFDAYSLEPVIEELKKVYPNSPLIIAGDDDVWKDHNIGRENAQQAALKYGCSFVFPSFKDTTSKPTDFNDLHLREGLEEVQRQLQTPCKQTTLKALNARELLSLEIPSRELILSPFLPEQGLAMIHAPRGIGKTHVSLTIAYAVAMGGQVFNGKWTVGTPRKVLFVDGEMSLSAMQERLAKIIKSHDSETPSEDNLLIITPDLQSEGIADLSTPEGQKIIEEHLNDVKLLILDNHSSLCRRGRENESESWIPLQEWFLKLRRRGISVLLIHHSNKAGAQRGTSRKEDLLDTVITLRKPENYDPREGARFEVHYEKARGFFGEDAAPFEASLKEEEGKFLWQVRPVEDTQMSKLIELKKGGLTQRQVAQETGMSAATVNRRFKEVNEKELYNGLN